MRGKQSGVNRGSISRRIIPARAGQTQSRSYWSAQVPDHPRACGANCFYMYFCDNRFGSSPRVRGKPDQAQGHRQPLRIIPARAGQASPSPRPCCRWPDHPRACGANFLRRSVGADGHGSSPRVRGKRTGRHQETDRRPDHPRACGANSRFGSAAYRLAGSSPRVRGKHGSGRRFPGGVRIIPARAGQTLRRGQWHRHDADHPRACGANGLSLLLTNVFPWIIPARAGQTATANSNLAQATDHTRACGANSTTTGADSWNNGSSPRVRGKHAGGRNIRVIARIIPARAEQTVRRGRGCAVAADHPRACGANNATQITARYVNGSSPRVRGKLPAYANPQQMVRIIPARAGQTLSPRMLNISFTDHPRACGANYGGVPVIQPVAGSSPRVRGKHRAAQLRVQIRRIIPARAGQTG